MSELITISIPTYRRPSLLLHSLHSVFIQDYRPLEIDVSDDSPSSESGELIRSISLPSDVSLRYQRNSPALRQSGNVNQLFSAARGSKLLLLHDDDALLPGAISALYDAFSMSPSVIATYGLQQVLHENGELSPADAATYNGFAHRTSELAGLQRDPVACALWMQFPNNSYLIKTELARQIGYRSEQEVGNSVDADFGIRLALANQNSHFVLLDRYTSQYRLTSSGHRMARDGWAQAFDQMVALDGLTPYQIQARDATLRRVVVEALVEDALHGKRKRALQLLRSPFYPRDKFTVKTAYHLAVIAAPSLVRVRDMIRGR